MVAIGVGQRCEQPGMCVDCRQKLVAQGHGMTENSLAGPRHPKALYIVHQSHDIGGRGVFLQVDAIVGRQATDKDFRGLGEFVVLDFEVGNHGIPRDGCEGSCREFSANALTTRQA